MARRIVDIDGRAVTVSPLEAPSAGNRHIAILPIPLTDDTTGRAPLALPSASFAEPLPGATVRTIDSGLVIVAGKANEAFSPSLAANATIAVDIAAPRFVTRHVEVTFACALRTLTAMAGPVLTLDSVTGLSMGTRLLISTANGSPVALGAIAVLGPGLNQVTLATTPTASYPAGSPVQPLPPAPTIDLHREPVLISGRVLKRSGASVTVLANADVTVSKLWRQAPLAGAATSPEPPVAGGPIPATPWPAPIASIWPPLYADFPAGAAMEIEDRPLDGAMPLKLLLDDSADGDMQLRLSDAAALAIGDVLAVDADDDARREIVEVTGIALSGTAIDWARVTFNNPLALPHRAGRIVRRLSPTVPSATSSLNYAGVTGDGALLFDTTGIAGTHQVRVVDTGPPIRRSYHRLSIYSAVTDADGFYRLPPLTRAGKIEIAAQDSGSPAKGSVELAPDYSLPETQRDVTVS